MALPHLPSIFHQTPLLSPHHTALFISAFDDSTYKRHFLSAAHDGGPVTHLMTLDHVYPDDAIQVQHFNGLVCFTCMDAAQNSKYNFVINPSTHEVLKLPDQEASMTKCSYMYYNFCYLFGFDESRNEHKILNFRKRKPLAASPDEPSFAMEVVIFSMSDYSWRKIDAEPPIGFAWDWDSLWLEVDVSVCVNSVVHLMLSGSFDILAFDLRTEKFSVINTPQGVRPQEIDTEYTNKRGEATIKVNNPLVININGSIGVVCHDRVVENNEMHIWILHDYVNRVWVREVITFPESWIELGEPFPEDSFNTDEIIFSGDVTRVLVYNRRSRCFKLLKFTSGHQFPLPRTLHFDHIKCYIGRMMPL